MFFNISPPYPEVTLDTFGFPVDSRLAARLVVLWPPMAKVTIDKVKNVFLAESNFFKTFIKINYIFVESNGQGENVSFCLVFHAF